MEPFSCFSGSGSRLPPSGIILQSFTPPPSTPSWLKKTTIILVWSTWGRNRCILQNVYLWPRRDSSTLCIWASPSADSPLASGLIISQIQGEDPAKRQLLEDCCWFRLRLGTRSGDCHSTWIGALSFQRHLGKNEAETRAAAVANAGQFCVALLDFLEVIFF